MYVPNAEIEVNPHFRRVEVETEVPEGLKKAATSPEISDIVNDPKAKLIVGQNNGYVARIHLVDTAYLTTFVKFGILVFGHEPDCDWASYGHMDCDNAGIIRRFSLQVIDDLVWIYTGRRAPYLSKALEDGVAIPGSIWVFFKDLGIDWEDLDDIQIADYIHYGFFASLPYVEYDKRINMLRDFCREKRWFGFKGPQISE